MTPARSTIAAIRYGYGFHPKIAAPSDANELLSGLTAPDKIAHQFPVTSFKDQVKEDIAYKAMKRARNRQEDGAKAVFKKAQKKQLAKMQKEMINNIIRPMISPDGFRERIVRFWADHFSIVAQGKGLKSLTTAYVEEAIRPHITGSFSDLLRSASIHPVMLIYLDQVLSVGPNSPIGKKKKVGLNENLAREILELHTLGVGSAYTQMDVREFAELLTGLNFRLKQGFKYQPRMAEPGAEEVLGQSYGGGKAEVEHVYQALDDLAHHPDTANHIARKLVVHFVSDDPDESYVDHVASAFLESDGDLMAVYSALLEHPQAWKEFGQKAKQPFDYIVSSLRALDVSPELLLGLNRKRARLYLSSPMQIMGQPYQLPSGPDGWPEGIEDWITPQGLAARIQWALMTVSALEDIGDPEAFTEIALKDAASKILLRSVGAAETRIEGTVLVLASPEFNRR